MQLLVLASGSRYRAELLARLNLPYCQFSPEIDETALVAENPKALARRLAREKAQTATAQHLKTLFPELENTELPVVVASDQVAAVGEQILGKPGTILKAEAQLRTMRAKSVAFYTALHLTNLQTGAHFEALDTTIATLRDLDDVAIRRYVEADQPLDCAGSFKVESLGISLFTAIDSKDPTALIGLPMIALCEGLRQFGLQLP